MDKPFHYENSENPERERAAAIERRSEACDTFLTTTKYPLQPEDSELLSVTSNLFTEALALSPDEVRVLTEQICEYSLEENDLSDLFLERDRRKLLTDVCVELVANPRSQLTFDERRKVIIDIGERVYDSYWYDEKAKGFFNAFFYRHKTYNDLHLPLATRRDVLTSMLSEMDVAAEEEWSIKTGLRAIREAAFNRWIFKIIYEQD